MNLNLNAVKTAVTSRAGRTLLKTQKHSPVILFGLGVAGMIGTVVMASRATLKLDESLDEINLHLAAAAHFREANTGKLGKNGKELYSKLDYQRDMVTLYTQSAVKVGRLYAPAIVCGVVSIAALTGSHYILSSRNVALTAAYAAIDKGFREYQQRVADEYGDDIAEKFRTDSENHEVREQMADGTIKNDKVAVKKGGSPYSFCFDEKSTSWSKTPSYNQMFLNCQQNFANDLLRTRGHVFLNEVLDMLGLPRTKAGAVVGWVNGHGDDFVDFGIFENNEYMGQEFVKGNERSVWLDFNVAGVIYDKI